MYCDSMSYFQRCVSGIESGGTSGTLESVEEGAGEADGEVEECYCALYRLVRTSCE